MANHYPRLNRALIWRIVGGDKLPRIPHDCVHCGNGRMKPKMGEPRHRGDCEIPSIYAVFLPYAIVCVGQIGGKALIILASPTGFEPVLPP